MPVVYALIGDLVGSRRAESRERAQRSLESALAATAALVPPVDRLEPTVGDEFQGVFADFASATLAGLLVRLHLGEVIDARCGIGAGEREVFDGTRTPMLQDGPAWWSARAAIEAVPARGSTRTRYDGSRAGDVPAGLANAYLCLRDALVSRLNARSRRMLLLAFEGRAQREIAEAEGISAPAVSQAFGKGVSAVREAQLMLTELAP